MNYIPLIVIGALALSGKSKDTPVSVVKEAKKQKWNNDTPVDNTPTQSDVEKVITQSSWWKYLQDPVTGGFEYLRGQYNDHRKFITSASSLFGIKDPRILAIPAVFELVNAAYSDEEAEISFEHEEALKWLAGQPSAYDKNGELTYDKDHHQLPTSATPLLPEGGK